MKKSLTIITLILLLISAAVTFKAQSRSPELTEITKKIERLMLEKMPGWRREAVTPMPAGDVTNDQVAVDEWINGDLVVKVAIATYQSQDNADKALKGHVNARTKKTVEVIGDEAFMLNESQILAFRKQNFVISVAELGRDRPKKDSALAKKFARYIADALGEPKN